MARVLVTGGTGVLGSSLVARLTERGHEAVSLSRRPRSAAAGPRRQGVEYLQGDVLSGAGLREAVEGTDAVVHAATSLGRKMRDTEVEGARRTLECARAAGSHMVYVSIVGVDRNRFPYYKAKLAAESVVESAGSAWTIQRATQFHGLVDWFLSLPVFPVTKHMAFQPIDVADVSDRLVDLVESGPGGRAQDLGGPDVLSVRQLAVIRRRVTGRRSRLVPSPAAGFLGDFDRGSNICPEHAHGNVTWEQWLNAGSAS